MNKILDFFLKIQITNSLETETYIYIVKLLKITNETSRVEFGVVIFFYNNINCVDFYYIDIYNLS